MKARVIKEACIGCGLCASIVPEVFEMIDEGVAKAIDEGIPVVHHEATKEAEDSCPVGAIEVEE